MNHMSAEIHFHSDKIASCVLTQRWEEDLLETELYLLSAFTARQVSNLGPDYGAEVGAMLKRLKPPDFTGASICTSPNELPSLTSTSYKDCPSLVEHREAARKRFVAVLTDESFKVHTKGFGFFGSWPHCCPVV